MKKIIKIALGVFLIGFFLGIVYSALNKAQSKEIFPPGLLTMQPIPVYCGPSFEVLLTTMNTFNMSFLGSGDVRHQGNEEGRLLGTLSFWYNADIQKGVFYLTVPASANTCLLGYGIDWQFDTDVLLDIVNEEIANESKQIESE
tara:strand:- start:10 stop:441 length:432 start_codon:yes stop_codon:yes gene_type:complete